MFQLADDAGRPLTNDKLQCNTSRLGWTDQRRRTNRHTVDFLQDGRGTVTCLAIAYSVTRGFVVRLIHYNQRLKCLGTQENAVDASLIIGK